MENQEQREDFIYYLEDLQSKARRWRLFLLDKLCEYCLTFISRFPVHKYKDFEGHYMEGLGPCGRCSMFFSSSALSIISPVSQSVVDFQYNWVYFPPDFNYVACPFCNHEAEIESPLLFHSLERNQVIYKIPAPWNEQPEKAMDTFKPIFQKLKEEYKKLMSREEAESLEQSSEILAFGKQEFYNAVKTGESKQQAHTTILVKQKDGSGLEIDSLNRIMIGIHRNEMTKQFNEEDSEERIPLEAALSRNDRLNEAVALFNSGDTIESKEILEQLYSEEADDVYINYNLAIVLYSTGEAERARQIMNQLNERKQWPL